MPRRQGAGGRARLRGLAAPLWRDRFLRRLALLSGGTLLGQAVLLLASPLLTRLYGPEAFGLLAVFTAVAGILGAVVCLGYELAIPISADDDEAAGMLVVVWLATLATSGGFALALGALGPWLAARLAMPELLAIRWLLPPALLLWGAGLALDYWWVRHGAFRRTAAQKVARAIVQALAQLALGLAGVGGQGLVIGLLLGYLGGLAYYLRALPGADWARLRAAWRRPLWPLAARHWHYPAYSTPATLLQNIALFLPAILVAVLYGPTTAGWFGLAQWTLELPVRLVAGSASAVFLGEARGLGQPGLRRLFLRTAGQFTALGLLGMAPLLAFGPPLFALVFGEPWRPAGTIVQCLVPLQLARFVVVPISQTLNLLRRQELHLVSAGLNLAVLGLAFALGHRLALPAPTTLLLLSLGSAAAYLVYLGLTWRALVRGLPVGGTGHPPG